MTGKTIPQPVRGTQSLIGEEADRFHAVVAAFERAAPSGARLWFSAIPRSVLRQWVEEMRRNCQFVRITGAGLKESHVHDVQITRESPNYRLG